ncbi:hypothetical protein FHS29_007328 [Saccharothrix tamanrassetensis]|uniref:Uncharacterized protein n=1 Tax=Saccharothrix tamanrassetensis TaxID=1051531 RepID=A0A841CTR5_9PSEU|nr:hypothetical protein [Saccharothrix tamanrassetensis]MBB5960700.1 hypothetical protein [Saccharothrix tamanrassetensis]
MTLVVVVQSAGAPAGAGGSGVHSGLQRRRLALLTTACPESATTSNIASPPGTAVASAGRPPPVDAAR